MLVPWALVGTLAVNLFLPASVELRQELWQVCGPAIGLAWGVVSESKLLLFANKLANSLDLKLLKFELT